MNEIYDLSDLKASIEVWFAVLTWFDPYTEWSWDNPNLRGWMMTHGYQRRSEIPPAGLWLINWSLEKRYQQFKGLAQLTGEEVL